MCAASATTTMFPARTRRSLVRDLARQVSLKKNRLLETNARSRKRRLRDIKCVR